METFQIKRLVALLHELQELRDQCESGRKRSAGNAPDGKAMEEIAETLELIKEHCGHAGLHDASNALFVATDHLAKDAPDYSWICADINHIDEAIKRQLWQTKIAKVDEDCGDYIEADALFGQPVNDAFPPSTRDIRESGNCLAVACSTAAVFHLMRVSEIGLRALARDRDLSFSNKPIDQQEWGTILGTLDGVISQMRAEPIKSWPNPSVKDVQLKFYAEVIQELRGFNEAWRRHLSHAREDGIYDQDYAKSIFGHVRLFMQKLATRISSESVTEKYWECA